MIPTINFNINCDCEKWCPRFLTCSGCSAKSGVTPKDTPIKKTQEVSKEILKSDEKK